MKAIDPFAEVTFFVPETGESQERLIERVARTCYQSSDKIGEGTDEKMIKMLIQRGHHAMLEFGYAIARIVADRGLCYDENTEVLTLGGWKFFKEVDSDDLFLTLNLDSNIVEYQNTYKFIEEDWDDDLIYGESSMVDFAVTPNHRMLLSNYDSRVDKNWKVSRCIDVYGCSVKFRIGLPCPSNYASGIVPSNDHLFNEKYWKKKHYSGKVYCVTVPNGTLYVKRNGKSFWCGNSHELVRHRLASYAQESTRFVDYSKEKYGGLLVIVQPTIDMMSEAKDEWTDAMNDAERHYFRLRELGIKPQEARSVLPIGMKTEIVIGANLREWRHIFKLRCALNAHPIIRGIMRDVLMKFYNKIPSLYKDLVEEFNLIDEDTRVIRKI